MNPFMATLDSGEPILGLRSVIASAQLVATMAAVGFDFVTMQRAARAAGKAVGTTAMSAADAIKSLVALGVNVLLYGTDAWLVGRASANGASSFKEAMQ
jgi:2-keto-3-deoxy-L-rhamnonate aldolase RhmA